MQFYTWINKDNFNNKLMQKISITVGSVELIIEPSETPTSVEILGALPFSSAARTWGEEVYFSTPVNIEKEADARDVVAAGEVAFWVEGRCIAIGYGPTPISQGDEIRLAAATNIWGKSLTDVSVLSRVNDGDPVTVQSLEE